MAARTQLLNKGHVLIGAFLAVTLFVGDVTAAQCPSTATLEGPAALTTPIARGLRAHGVTVGPSNTCVGRTVRAVVTSASPAKGLRLHIEDGFGRTSDRVIAAPEVAVSLIESWVVDDEADLLAVTPKAVTPTSAATIVATAPSAPVAATRLRLYGGPASILGSDRSVWGGGVAGGCGQLGRACLGAELAFARDLGLAGETGDAGTTRSLADAFVTAGLPLSSGRFLFLPSIGVGAGWVRTHLSAEGGDAAVTANTFGLRGKVAVLAGVSLSSHVGLALEVGGLVAPGARPAPPEEAMLQTANLPAEPRASLRAGLLCVVTP